MTNMPIVSVIIPTYNRGDQLCIALDSICGQLYRPIEIIVVDDGSTDDTAEFAQRWLQDHGANLGAKPILIRQENSGACAARNAGIRACRGDYIQFFDSDDLLLESKFSTAVEIMQQNPDVDLVSCDMERLNVADGARRAFKGADLGARPIPAEIARNYLATMIPVFRARLIREAGYWDESLLALQDWEYYARVLIYAKGVVHVSDVQCIACDHDGARISRSTTPARQLELERTRLIAIRSVLSSVMLTGGDRAAERRLSRLYVSAVLAVARLDSPHSGVAELAKTRQDRCDSKAFARAWLGLRIFFALPPALTRPAIKSAWSLKHRLMGGGK